MTPKISIITIFALLFILKFVRKISHMRNKNCNISNLRTVNERAYRKQYKYRKKNIKQWQQ